MKLEDVVNKEQLDELAPAGLVKQATTSLAQRAARGLGMKTAAARMGGKLQSQKRANVVWRQFSNYLGQIGKKFNNVTADEIREFMAGNGLSIPEDLKTLQGDAIVGDKNMLTKWFMQAQQGGARQQMQQRAARGGAAQGGFQQFLQQAQSLSPQEKEQLKAALG